MEVHTTVEEREQQQHQVSQENKETMNDALQNSNESSNGESALPCSSSSSGASEPKEELDTKVQNSHSTPGSSSSSQNQPQKENQEQESSIHSENKMTKFAPIPCFSGSKHGIKWSSMPKNSGTTRLPVTKESGLTADDLTQPLSSAYVDPDLAPHSDAEWMELWRQSFPDIADECKKPEDAIVFYGRQTEIERSFCKGTDIAHYFRGGFAYKDPDIPYTFRLRFVNNYYGLGTYVLRLSKVDEVSDSIREENERTDHVKLRQEITSRIEKADTTLELNNILTAVQKITVEFRDKGKTEKEQECREWEKLCQDKIELIKKSEPLQTDVDQSVEKGKEENEDEDFTRHGDEVPDVKLLEQDLGGVRDIVVKPDEQLVTKTSTEEEEQEQHENPKDTGKKKRKELLPHTITFLTRQLKSVGKKGDIYDIPFQELLLHTPDIEKEYEPFKDIDKETGKEHTRYDWITDRYFTGTLCAINATAASVNTSTWRETKVKVRIPCSVDGTQHEAVIVDHLRIRIIKMPEAQATGEVYHIVPFDVVAKTGNANPKTPFKSLHCSLSDRYIEVTGYRENTNVPVIMVIDRKDKTVTLLATNIPVSSCILSNVGGPPSLLIGFMDGSLVRHPLLFPINSDESTLTKGITYERPAAGTEKYRTRSIDHAGYFKPIRKLVEHGNRIVACTEVGLHLFKDFLPTTETCKPLGEDEEFEGRIDMALQNNASFDFRGNLMIVHKSNNAVQIVQIHDCKLESTVSKPVGLKPEPEDMDVEMSTIAIHPNAIIIFHLNGTRRVLEMKGYAELMSRGISTTDRTIVDENEDDRAKETRKKNSFLPKELSSSKTKGKGKGKGKGKKSKK